MKTKVILAILSAVLLCSCGSSDRNETKFLPKKRGLQGTYYGKVESVEITTKILKKEHKDNEDPMPNYVKFDKYGNWIEVRQYLGVEITDEYDNKLKIYKKIKEYSVVSREIEYYW